MKLARADIVSVARNWIGTPYLHQASLLHVGCDCLGLVRGVWRETIGAEPERFAPYAPDWAEATRGERLAEAGARHFVPADPVAESWGPSSVSLARGGAR
jgi:NlpC/P60 family putative phage cell wall peptidase